MRRLVVWTIYGNSREGINSERSVLEVYKFKIIEYRQDA